MLRRKIIVVIFSALLLTVQIGCSTVSNKNATDVSGKSKQSTNNVGNKKLGDKQKYIIDEFNNLIAKDVMISNVVAFIDRNISSVSPENASTMIINLEEAQKEYLPKLEEKINASDAVRKNIEIEHGYALDINKADSIEDKELKKLLIDMRDNGFKFETIEGYYFPVINYEFYKKYNLYVTNDIKMYIDIMEVESNKVPAKDAAIIISWDEILKRAQNQEKFINKYGESTRIDEVKQLYKRYVYLALYGADNTPLFSYDQKVMVPKAKSSYLRAVANSEGSEFMKLITEFIQVLEKNDYKLTNDVENFRKNALENIQQ